MFFAITTITVVVMSRRNATRRCLWENGARRTNTASNMALNMTSGLRSAVGLTRQTVRCLSKYSWEPKEVATHTGQVSFLRQWHCPAGPFKSRVLLCFSLCQYCDILVLQQWAANDYRLARFIDKEKQVNPSFAIDLVNQQPPIRSTKRVIFCDGGGGALGHPKVFINLVNRKNL